MTDSTTVVAAVDSLVRNVTVGDVAIVFQWVALAVLVSMVVALALTIYIHRVVLRGFR